MAVSQRIVEITLELHEASRKIHPLWNGKEAILEMKDAGSKQWKQMEWMGFYFEFICSDLFSKVLEMPGKKYGNTAFDAFGEISWDFKAHATNPRSPRSRTHEVIANDSEAIQKTIREYGHYGLILAAGKVEYDEDKSFKKWHDELKGGKSEYEKDRIKRKAKSRTRKTKFELETLFYICFDERLLSECSSSFQENFRNADGRPRRSKAKINMKRLPNEAVIDLRKF